MADKANLDGLIAEVVATGPDKAYLDGLIVEVISTGPDTAYLDGLIAQVIATGPDKAYLDGLIAQIVHDGIEIESYPFFRARLNETTTYADVVTAALTATRLASGQPSSFRDALSAISDRISSGQTSGVPFSLTNRTGNYDS